LYTTDTVEIKIDLRHAWVEKRNVGGNTIGDLCTLVV